MNVNTTENARLLYQLTSSVDLTSKLVQDPLLTFHEEFRYANGSIYRGQMIKLTGQFLREGFGLQVWPDGGKYQGYWHLNKAEGRGQYCHPDGDVFEGEFKEDRANGFGVYTHANGNRYRGAWRDDF